MKAEKLPSGNYRVRVYCGKDSDGRQIKKSFTAETEWEAMKMAKDFKDGKNKDSYMNLTVKQAEENYIESRKNVIEETTLLGYEKLCRNMLQSLMEIKLKDLTPIDVQNAVNIDSVRLSPKSVRNAYSLFKSVLNFYECGINLKHIRLPKLIRKEKELPDFKTIFQIVKETESELPVLLSAWLSLRVGEITGLQFQDIDKDKIRIRRTVIMTANGEKIRESCKTDKSMRTIQLPPYISGLINKIPHKADTDFIIPKSRHAVYSQFKRLIKKHDIDMTFHDLRHLNASVMLMLGVPDKYAIERGGWSTEYVLKNVYQQTFSSERQRVDNLIDDYFQKIVSWVSAEPENSSHDTSHNSL